MSRFSTFLIIIASMISYPFAYSAIPQQDESFQNNSSSKVQESKPKTGMASSMSGVVDRLLIYANSLELTEEQKNSLSLIPDKYVYPLKRIEADYDIARMKINNLMQNPNFEIAEFK